MSNETEVELIRKAAARVEAVEANHRKAEETIRDLMARLAEIETKAATYTGVRSNKAESIGDLLRKSDDFAAFMAERTRSVRVPMQLALKSLLGSEQFPPAGSPTSTYPVDAERAPGLWGFAMRRIPLLTALPSIPIGTNSLEYVRITYTNNAGVQTTEGALKNETTITTSLQTAKVVTVSHHLPVSRQVLADAPMLEADLRTLLAHGAIDKAEREVVSGTGDLEGLTTASTAFVGSYTNRGDLLGECAATMDDSGYSPSHLLLNPLDWFAIQVRKASGSGEYAAGSPVSPIGPSLWGLPVVTSAAIPQNTAFVVDAGKLRILDRQQVAVEIGITNDQFTRNALTILGEARLGLAVYDTGGVRRLSFGGSPTIE